MVCFVNVQSVERIIYSIFNRINLEWTQRTLRQFTQAAWHHRSATGSEIFTQFGYNTSHRSSNQGQ